MVAHRHSARVEIEIDPERRCSREEDIFKFGEKQNPLSHKLVERYKKEKTEKLHFTLRHIEDAYHDQELSQDIREEIHTHIEKLYLFVMDNVRIKASLCESPKIASRVQSLLQRIKRAVFSNTMEIKTLDDAIRKIYLLEEQCKEARALRNRLGFAPHAFGCAARIREQLKLFWKGPPEHITPDFLLQKVWPAYRAELQALFEELTDERKAHSIMEGYHQVFDTTGLPEIFHPEQWSESSDCGLLTMLYKKARIFIFVNLLDEGDAVYSIIRHIYELRDDDPNQFSPCVGRNMSIPLGVNRSLAKQLQVAASFTGSAGIEFELFGKIDIISRLQQASITHTQQLKRFGVRTATKMAGGHLAYSHVKPGRSISAGRARGKAHPRVGIAFGPKLRKLA